MRELAWASALVLSYGEVAAAESPIPSRRDASMACETDVVATPASGEVPAILPRIEFSHSVPCRLVNDRTGMEVRTSSPYVPGRVFLLLEEPLVAGERYVLLREDCPSAASLADYLATPAARPETLGVLEIGPLHAFYPRPGSAVRAHYVEVTLVPDPALAPVRDAYDWWLDVGTHETTARPISAGLTVELGVYCPRGGVGSATITGLGSVLPGPADLQTDTITPSFVCDDAIVVDADTRRPLSPEEIAELEHLATIDARTPALDASVALPDAFVSIDGGSAAMPTEPDTNPNCSAHPTGERTGGLALVLFAVAISAARRAARVSGARGRGACGRRRARCASSA